MVQAHTNAARPVLLVKLKDEDYSLSPVIQHAHWLADCLDARVCLFSSVYKKDYRHAPHELSERQRKEEAHVLFEGRRKLEACVSALELCGLSVQSSINWKKPTKQALQEYINEIEPDYIVTSRPRATLFDRALVFDPDWQVVQEFGVPVIFVNDSPANHRSPLIWAAVDPMHDSEEHRMLNDKIIEQAKFLAAKTNSAIQLVHSFGTAKKLAEAAIGLTGSDYFPVQAIEQETYELHMVKLKELANRHGLAHSQIHNVPGLAQIVLPILASRKHPYFIVAGANKKGVVSHFFYGSTTKKLMHRVSGALCIVTLPEP